MTFDEGGRRNRIEIKEDLIKNFLSPPHSI